MSRVIRNALLLQSLVFVPIALSYGHFGFSLKASVADVMKIEMQGSAAISAVPAADQPQRTHGQGPPDY
jgi:hypothetical protein